MIKFSLLKFQVYCAIMGLTYGIMSNFKVGTDKLFCQGFAGVLMVIWALSLCWKQDCGQPPDSSEKKP